MVRSAIFRLIGSQCKRSATSFSHPGFPHPGHQHYRANLHHQNARLQPGFYSAADVTAQRRSWSSRAQEDSYSFWNGIHKDGAISDKLFAAASRQSLHDKWMKKHGETAITAKKWMNCKVGSFELAKQMNIESGELLQLLKDDQKFVSELRPECRMDDEVLQEYQELLALMMRNTEKMLKILHEYFEMLKIDPDEDLE